MIIPTAWILFGVSLVLLVYTYVGYPLLAAVLAVGLRRPHQRKPMHPTVSIIILARNEARDIADKIESTLVLDYPREKFEIIVASDGSTDETDSIVRSYENKGVRLFRAEGHPGKTSTTNRVVPTTRGEILIFSDATGRYDRNVIRMLVRNFADPKVGAVSGRVVYSYGDTISAKGFKAYQLLVTLMRRAESRFGTATSVSGSICAIRRELFRVLPPYLDFDMAHPYHVALRGLRTLYEPEAICNEKARAKSSDEFAARVRMALFAFSFIPYWVRGIGYWKNWIYVFQMVSHKLLRWISPFLLLVLLASSIVLALVSDLARLLLAIQLIVYLAAAAGSHYQGQGKKLTVLGPPLFFVTINLAFLAGFWYWLRGKRTTSWEPQR